jgi:hypothetical protein
MNNIIVKEEILENVQRYSFSKPNQYGLKPSLPSIGQKSTLGREVCERLNYNVWLCAVCKMLNWTQVNEHLHYWTGLSLEYAVPESVPSACRQLSQWLELRMDPVVNASKPKKISFYTNSIIDWTKD